MAQFTAAVDSAAVEVDSTAADSVVAEEAVTANFLQNLRGGPESPAASFFHLAFVLFLSSLLPLFLLLSFVLVFVLVPAFGVMLSAAKHPVPHKAFQPALALLPVLLLLPRF